MQLLLIRHGESEADILQVHEGRADFSLTERGYEQVRLMAAQVSANFPPDKIWASTLKRATQTAEILAEQVGCPLQLEDELMEYNNGVLAGLSFEEAKKYSIPTELHEPIQNGESAIQFRMRIETIFSKIITSAQGKYDRIAIVAHGGVLNCLLRSFFKMPVDQTYGFYNGDTTINLVEIKRQNRIVHFLNNTSHLDQLESEVG